MLKSIAFDVTGGQLLVCEGCEERIERLLKSLRGVRKVRARARNQRIEVLFDTAFLAATEIADRLRSAGYETKLADQSLDAVT